MRNITSIHKWPCTNCGALLGCERDGLMHLSFARGPEYFVGFPVCSTCNRCGTMNRRVEPTGVTSR